MDLINLMIASVTTKYLIFLLSGNESSRSVLFVFSGRRSGRFYLPRTGIFLERTEAGNGGVSKEYKGGNPPEGEQREHEF